MKKRKILVLFPLLGLLLSGCTFQEGYTTTKNWISDHIIQPIKNLFNKNKDSGGGSDSGKDSGKDSGGDSGKETVTINFGTVDSPLSLSQFQVEIEKAIDYSTVEEGKTVTYQETPFYVKGTVKSNEELGAHSEGQIRFTNLVDSSNSSVAVTGYFLSFDSSVDSATYGVKNAMAGKEVIIKGYGMLFNKAGAGKTYEIGNQKKDGEKGYILSVIAPPPTPGTNYGTLQEPLTASEACALLDGEDPSKSTMYVGGEVKSNTAWSTQYNNVDIVISDGSKDFTIFRTATFPQGYDGTAITENSLVGKQVIASGTGKIYNASTYELDQGCVVEYIEGYQPKTISGIVSASVATPVGLGSTIAPSQIDVVVSYAEGGTDTGVVTEVIKAPTNEAGEDLKGTCTVQGWADPVEFTYSVASEAKGTATNPYTVAEARAAIDSGSGVTGVYATGIVTRIAYAYSNKSMSFYFSDDGTQTSELEAYKLASDTDPDVEVGDTVTVTGNLTKFSSTYEFAEGCTLYAHTKPTVSSVSVSGSLSTTEYNIGSKFSHNGLTATAALSNGINVDVSSKATWVISPDTAETAGDQNISIYAEYKGVQSQAQQYAVNVSSAPAQDVVYNKITAAPSSWTGTYILVNDTASVAWTGVDTSGCVESVTISNNSITNPSSSVVTLEVATQGSGYSIKVVGGTNNGKYLDGKKSGTAEANGIYFSSTAVELTFSFETDWVKITAGLGQVLRYNNAASNGNWFRFYKSTTYTNQQPIQLYKLAS